jgi:hypothetical protein
LIEDQFEAGTLALPALLERHDALRLLDFEGDDGGGKGSWSSRTREQTRVAGSSTSDALRAWPA